MIKSLCLIVLLVALASQQTITPYYILPAQTTLNTVTSYSFLFQTDTPIATQARISLTFPIEFDSGQLAQVNRVRWSDDGGALQAPSSWTLYFNTFVILVGSISTDNITIVIDNVQNPKDIASATTSSYFIIQTQFNDVPVATNQQFGRVPFTSSPIITSGGLFSNQLNTYI